MSIGTRAPVGFSARVEKWAFQRYEWATKNPGKAWFMGLGLVGLAYYSNHINHTGEAVSSNSNKVYQVQGGVGVITQGQLESRQDTWELRNMERNYSIMTQDHHRQLDDVKYRYERSKDNDYARHNIKAKAA